MRSCRKRIVSSRVRPSLPLGARLTRHPIVLTSLCLTHTSVEKPLWIPFPGAWKRWDFWHTIEVGNLHPAVEGAASCSEELLKYCGNRDTWDPYLYLRSLVCLEKLLAVCKLLGGNSTYYGSASSLQLCKCMLWCNVNMAASSSGFDYPSLSSLFVVCCLFVLNECYLNCLK